jgi:hypothetical protein
MLFTHKTVLGGISLNDVEWWRCLKCNYRWRSTIWMPTFACSSVTLASVKYSISSTACIYDSAFFYYSLVCFLPFLTRRCCFCNLCQVSLGNLQLTATVTAPRASCKIWPRRSGCSLTTSSMTFRPDCIVLEGVFGAEAAVEMASSGVDGRGSSKGNASSTMAGLKGQRPVLRQPLSTVERLNVSLRMPSTS